MHGETFYPAIYIAITPVVQRNLPILNSWGDFVFGQFGIHRDPLDRLYSEKQFMTPLE